MKVAIINGSAAYTNLFARLGHEIISSAMFRDADLIVFTGGADVTPALYGDKAHHTTFTSMERDRVESYIFQECQKLGKKFVGICRGAQFLNVMNGGRMYQDVRKHAVWGGHEITDLQTGETVHVSSTHHQMMMPAPEAVLVASSALGGEREWFDGQIAKRDVSKEDIEVLFYPNTDSLCFQPHPEFTGEEWEGMYNYFRSLLNRFITIEVQ